MTWYEILGLAGGGGIVGHITTFLFLKPKLRKESAGADLAEVEATDVAMESLRKQIEHLQGSLTEAYDTTKKMQGIINEFRSINLQLTKELAAAQIELAKAKARENGCMGCAEEVK